MSRSAPAGRPGDELREAVRQVAGAAAGPGAVVGRVSLRRHAYGSSHPLTEARVTAGGRSYHMLVKDLAPRAVTAPARGVRPRFVTAPGREERVYADILAPADLGTPRVLGSVTAPGRRWLFLELVPGHPLTEEGELAVWEAAAGWAARLHTRYPYGRVPKPVRPLLVHIDRAWLTRWVRRAVRFVHRGPDQADQLRVLRRVAAEYDRVVDRVLDWRPSLVHGDYFPANVLVAQELRGEGSRVCPVDWESAGVGPGLLDLAALTAGAWPDDARAGMAAAYYRGLPPRSRPAEAAFREALVWCRLHVAVQCLGWAERWAPPGHQTYNWLDDVVRLADRLGL